MRESKRQRGLHFNAIDNHDDSETRVDLIGHIKLLNLKYLIWIFRA